MSKAKQRKSTLKTVVNTSFLSLFIVAITACSDKEEVSVTLTHPASPAITTATADAQKAADTQKVVEAIKNDDETLALTIPKKSPPSATPEYPFQSLALGSQLETKFGRNVTASNSFTPEGFYPLGWSKNGDKFAYASQHITNGTTDASTFNVFVQDLITDKVIWRTPPAKSSLHTENINRWELHKKSILAALKKNKISLDSDFSLQSPPIALKKDTLSYNVKVLRSKKYSSLRGYEILLKSSQKGIKKVANETFKNKSFDAIGSKSQVHVLGYMQGANPNRIGLLVGILELGSNGTQSVHYKIVGASLTAGKWR